MMFNKNKVPRNQFFLLTTADQGAYKSVGLQSDTDGLCLSFIGGKLNRLDIVYMQNVHMSVYLCTETNYSHYRQTFEFDRERAGEGERDLNINNNCESKIP